MFFELFDEDIAGWRPAPLPEVAGPQARVLQRTVEPIVESFVPVPMTDVPAPQTVQMVATLSHLDTPIAGQVIEVPCSSRCARTVLRTPQTAEQLVKADR